MTTDGTDGPPAGWPRARPPLPPRQRELFGREYVINRTGGSLINRIAMALEGWMHRKVAVLGAGTPGDILELGAGTLNHVPHEPIGPAYDVVEPFGDLVARSAHRGRVRDHVADIGDIPAGNRYARIISIAVLEHLVDLPRVVAASALRLAPGGIFQAAIPSEGGFLWGLAWRTTTGVGYRLRTGADYGPVMRHEHVNDQWEILAVLRACFADVRVDRFPSCGSHGSLYACLTARDPDPATIARWMRRGS